VLPRINNKYNLGNHVPRPVVLKLMCSSTSDFLSALLNESIVSNSLNLEGRLFQRVAALSLKTSSYSIYKMEYSSARRCEFSNESWICRSVFVAMVNTSHDKF